MEDPEGVLSSSELHPHCSFKLNHNGTTPMKEAMVQGFDKTLADAFELGF